MTKGLSFRIEIFVFSLVLGITELNDGEPRKKGGEKIQGYNLSLLNRTP